MALTDALTGAFNRRYFMKYAQRNVQRAQSAETHLSLLALDIDHFKAINDRYGHEAGDVVLVKGWIEHEMWVLEDTEFVAFLAPVREDLRPGATLPEHLRTG